MARSRQFAIGVGIAIVCAGSPCFAQQARTATVAADSVIAFDEAVRYRDEHRKQAAPRR